MHCQPVGNGFTALKYLAPYIFRVAISKHRILKLAEGKVTACLKFQIGLQCIRLSLTLDYVARRRHMNPYPLARQPQYKEGVSYG